MRFDVVLTNPPFQDTVKRGKTPHKLWIDFTLVVFDKLLKEGGALCQVSPASFQSPSSKVLTLMRTHQTAWITFDAERHFPGVGSTFAAYLIYKHAHNGAQTVLIRDDAETSVLLDDQVFYLPTDGPVGLPIHRRVIFDHPRKLAVEWDYVTAHNILLRDADSTLSKTPTEHHVHELFHTNSQRWWSSVKQEFASWPKVMWTRSGYQVPFYEPGELGGTDMAYYVRVESEDEGKNLAGNLNLELIRYIFITAKWSGFGNERVFAALPDIPRDHLMTNDELYKMFGITKEERAYVRGFVGSRR
jgi:hypothetical protein